MEIRPCTDDDLAIPSSRWKVYGCVHEEHPLGQLADDTTYVVAGRGEEPLISGVVQWDGCLRTKARQMFSRAVEINHLQVRNDCRGQGVGTALIAAAERLIWCEGRLQEAVGAADGNPHAERLYLSLGYRKTGIADVS
ncbi:GNAT family N-acetyltransferase [Arthrobacter sp. MYb227]|uniref:GNAT family N-acetyltransferase n=1 Tax=Arthrobacter sp. MYb227 TaxID=1848601 RepID=UPI0026CF02C7